MLFTPMNKSHHHSQDMTTRQRRANMNLFIYACTSYARTIARTSYVHTRLRSRLILRWLSMGLLGLHLISCAGGNTPCVGKSGLAGHLPSGQGASFGGSIQWSSSDTEVGECTAFVTVDGGAEGDGTVRLSTAYHCLRTMILDRLAMNPQDQQKLRIVLDVNKPPSSTTSTAGQCQYEYLSIDFDLSDSTYLTMLKDKFTTQAQRKNLALPIKKDNYAALKADDQVWLEPFTHTGTNPLVGHEPLTAGETEEYERIICNTHTEGDESAENILKSMKDKSLRSACYTFSDLAHVDLTVDPGVWTTAPPACLHGLKVDNLTLPSSSETWEDKRQKWQLGVQETVTQVEVVNALKDFHTPIYKGYESDMSEQWFNHGTNNTKSSINISIAQNLSIWTRFTSRKGGTDYTFQELILAWKDDLKVSQQDTSYHVHSIVKQYWGLLVLYDSNTYEVAPGSSGSLMTTATEDPNISRNTMMIASLYSVDNKEVHGATTPNGPPLVQPLSIVSADNQEEEQKNTADAPAPADPSSLTGGDLQAPQLYNLAVNRAVNDDSNDNPDELMDTLEQGDQGTPLQNDSRRKLFELTMVSNGGFPSNNSQDIRAVGDCSPNISN